MTFTANQAPFYDLWSGEVEDFVFDWTQRMWYSAYASATYGHTATALSGSGWTAVGETASAFAFYIPAGLSASASATAMFWTAYLKLSGSSSATASSMTAVLTKIRVQATGASAAGAVSARMLTSSGRELRHVWTARVQG